MAIGDSPYPKVDPHCTTTPNTKASEVLYHPIHAHNLPRAIVPHNIECLVWVNRPGILDSYAASAIK
jgi:hypothetical protein